MSARSIRRNHDRAARTAERRLSRRAKLAAGVTIVGASAAFAPAAQAANFTVDTLDDPGNGDGCALTDCSLREAIEDADANAEADTITFASGLTGTIHLAFPLEVYSPEGIDVDGPGVSVVSISGDTDSSGGPSSGDTPILYVEQGAKVAVSDLTLTQGYVDCSCSGKYAGAITMQRGSTVSIADAAITDNIGYTGGAIANWQGALDVRRTELSGNYTGYIGGAIFASGPKYSSATSPPGEGEPMTTTITSSELTDNTAAAGGGAWVQGAKYFPGGDDPIPELGQTTITGTTFSGNEAESGGGLASKYGETDVSTTTFRANSADYGAGATFGSGETTVTGSTFADNGDAVNSAAGGLAVGKYARFEMQGSTVTGNAGAVAGGMAVDLGPYTAGRYATAPVASVTIERSTIAGNEGGVAGGLRVGGIRDGSSLEVVDSTISGNDATASTGITGGGIAFTSYLAGDVGIVNSTISGNQAAYGGGISVGAPYATPPYSPTDSYGAPVIKNSTIAANTATVAGGGVYLGGYNTDPATPGSPSASADLPLSSTIVADNTANGAADDLAAATVDQPGSFQAGSSLIETPGSAPVVQTPAGSSILGTDPQLGPLADNGGPTKTQLPATGSPVVDKGVANGLATDQRGLARVSGGGADIGSVELQVTPPPPDTTGPVITITKPPKKRLGTRKARRNVRVGFKSDEPGSTFECKVNGAAFKPCDRPFKMKLKAKHGKGAKYKIRIRGTDPAGNTGAAVKVKTRVVRKG